MTMQVPKEIEMIMADVTRVTEMVYKDVIRVLEWTGYFQTLKVKTGNTLEELEMVMDKFMEENEERLEDVNFLIQDGKYERHYIDIGVKSDMSMGKIREVIMEGITPKEFGMSLVETNVHYAILQKLNNFTEINYNAVHHLSKMDMMKDDEEYEGYIVITEEIVREVLVDLEKKHTPDENLFAVMNANQFTGFIAKKINAESVEKEYLVFAEVAGRIIDVDEELGRKVADLNMKMFTSKMERGEADPLALLFDIEAVVGSFLDYIMSIILETYHHMVMDGKGAEEINIRTVIEDIDSRE